MSGLELDLQSIKEFWKKDSNLSNWLAGQFDYEIIINNDFTQAELDEMCEWLAHNCKLNFIASLRTTEILAGGTSDNLSTWNHRNNSGFYTHKTTTLHIRLYKDDIVAFRMRWIL